MTIEINNPNTQGFTNNPRVSRSPVPTDKPDITFSQTNDINTENVVRLNFETRQAIATEQAQTPTRSTSEESIAQALSDVSDAVQSISRRLEFRIDDNSGRTVITVRDSETQEVIRQIPSEQLLDVAARIEEIKQDRNTDSSVEAQGILFTSKT
jgi:flagellar protein FlaG